MKTFLTSHRLKLFAATGLCLATGRYLVSSLVSENRDEKGPEKWPATEFYWLKCPSGNIIYTEFGGLKDGPPLLFIHGLNANRYQWYYQREHFKDKYRLIFIDLPGHGRSAKPKDLSIPSLAEDLNYLLEYFDIKDGIAYGHSMGGMMLMEYCIRYKNKERLQAIILQHTTYTNPLKTIKFSSFFTTIQDSVLVPFLQSAKKYNALLWTASWLNYLNGLGSAFFRYIFFTGTQTAAQTRFMSRLSAGVSPQVVSEAILKMIRFDESNRLSEIEVPTLVIGAMHDRITRLPASNYLHSNIKNSELAVMEEGHLSLMENHTNVNMVIDRFIAGLRTYYSVPD